MHMLKTLSILCLLTCFTGCVERTITVDSSPSGALVYLNEVEIGRTPTTVPFTFYGKYSVRLEKSGYATLNTSADAVAPWWDKLGPDLFSEMSLEDKHVDLRWHFELEQTTPLDEPAMLDRAKQLRSKLNIEQN